MNTLSLPTEKVVLSSVWRGWPPLSHSLVAMEPEATQRRVVELRSSIRTAAGPWMTAPAIDAGATMQQCQQKKEERKEKEEKRKA